MSNRIHIAGWGAVSPAGWTSSSLVKAILDHQEFPASLELRHPDAPSIPCRRVPTMDSPAIWLRQPRLRRSSPITRFAVSAALEALNNAEQSGTFTQSLGVIFAVQNGSVNYSSRFFAEVLANPSLASPILFPETVFNAPSSHVSSLLASPSLNNTLVSDAGGFLSALDMAAQWLDDGQVTDCLIVTAEEYDWLSAESLSLVPGSKIASEGAAALWMRRTEQPSPKEILLEQITEAATITNEQSRSAAIQRMRLDLEAPDSATIVSAESGQPAWDRPHFESFASWQGPRFAIQPQFGHGFSVLGGWQCVLACELLRRGACDDAVVTADTGANQAQAAWFTCSSP